MSLESATNIEDYWTSYKKILVHVESFLASEVSVSEFTEFLKRNKQCFATLLQNPPKSAKRREELRKGVSDGGTPLLGLSSQALSPHFKQEAIVLSDMYNMDELIALDLLVFAECQLQYYPGMTRGLVAVILYYDSRCAVVKALKALVQQRKGLWLKTSGYPESFTKFLDSYLNELVDKHLLFDQIYQLLNDLDLSNELEILQKNRAIGPSKHCSKVINLCREIRRNLAEIVYLWSAQTGLTQSQTKQLINFLENITIIGDKGNEVIDDVNLIMQMALIHAIDLSAFNFHEDNSVIIANLPIFTEGNFLIEVATEIKETKFRTNEMGAMSLFATAICVATLRNSNLQNSNSTVFMDLEFTLIDKAMKANIFDVLTLSVLGNEMFYTEEFLVRRMHYLITDFIVEMPRTIKQMKVVADKVSQTTLIYANEGLQAPSDLCHVLEKFLLMMATFYSKEANRHGLNLGLDYWKNQNQRQVALNSFLMTVNDDVTPISLAPYLKLLCSLARNCEPVARLTFNYLKQNEFSVYNNKISLDHFFNSFQQYFCHLRQENVPRSDTVYQQFHQRGIKPHEIRGLHAVLEVIRTITDADDYSRIAIVEHPNWSAISIFFGLISCPIPIYLKADILLTLASLAKSVETAVAIWNALESSQILPTIPSTSNYQPRGIKTELDEVETSMEKYPLTVGVLTLLNSLVDVVQVPPTLGSSLRKPGFDPYFNFVLNSVLMKFHSRPYKDQNEKWQVAQLCLKLFNKLLQQYEPEPVDFAADKDSVHFSLPPGFHIMMQFCSNSELFSLITFIIDNGAEVLDSFNYTTGSSWLEKCTLEALQILENCLKLETDFFNAVSNSVIPNLVLTKIHQLLYSVNPRSGRADYLLKISKYLQFQSWLPVHCLVVINILIEAMKFPVTNTHLMKSIVYDSSLDTSFRLGFVECLDLSFSNLYVPNSNSNTEQDLIVNLKIHILKLLNHSFRHSAPNLAHYLYGFDVRKDIIKTVFEKAGINGNPRTCLHAIMDLIQNLDHFESNQLADHLLQSVYMICSDPITCNSTLRFIRSQAEFIPKNLTIAGSTNDSHLLNKNAWLMKIIAIEIRICAKKKQITNFNKVVGYLLNWNENSPQTNFRQHTDSRELFLLKSFIDLDVVVENGGDYDMPKWDYFDPNLLKTVLKKCTVISKDVSAIDIKHLHEVLMMELGSVQSSLGTGDRQLILKEILSVLDYANDWNREQLYLSAVLNWIDGWRQVVSILFMNFLNQSELLKLEDRQMLILRIIETIFDKLRTIDYLKSNHLIGIYLSQLMVILLDKLKQLSIFEQKLHNQQEITYNSQKPNQDHVESVVSKNVMILRKILTESIEWLIENDLVNMDLKTNLYLVIIAMLNILNDNSKSVKSRHLYVNKGDHNNFNVGRSLEIASDVVTSYGDRLLNLICSDCISGNSNAAMLAMTILQQFLSLNIDSNLIKMAHNKGQLKYLIESLYESDAHLKLLLNEDIRPESLRLFYAYETKISLLCEVAGSQPNGAEMLLEFKILSYLSSMSVFSDHPEVLSYHGMDLQYSDMNSVMPSVTTKYHQILFPALDFCNSILNSCEETNQAATNQVLFFLLSHFESFQVILRSAHVNMYSSFMKELALITGLIARTASPEIFTSGTTDVALSTNRAHLYAYQKYMISLMHRFVLNNNVVKSLKTINFNRDSEDYDCDIDKFYHCLQVIFNVVLFVRKMMNKSDLYDTSIVVIFQPIIDEQSTDKHVVEHNPPHIGILVGQLTSCVQYYHEGKLNYEMLKKRLNNIPTMISNDLKPILDDFDSINDIDAARIQAFDIVSHQIAKHENELNTCSLIVSQCIYILWCHLDYYMLKAVPRLIDGLPTLVSETNWEVSADNVGILKKKLVKVFNDHFCKQLIGVSNDLIDSESGINEALLRRIKRLIQFVPVK